jgi:hypothetical protein
MDCTFSYQFHYLVGEECCNMELILRTFENLELRIENLERFFSREAYHNK